MTYKRISTITHVHRNTHADYTLPSFTPSCLPFSLSNTNYTASFCLCLSRLTPTFPYQALQPLHVPCISSQKDADGQQTYFLPEQPELWWLGRTPANPINLLSSRTEINAPALEKVPQSKDWWVRPACTNKGVSGTHHWRWCVFVCLTERDDGKGFWNDGWRMTAGYRCHK